MKHLAPIFAIFCMFAVANATPAAAHEGHQGKLTMSGEGALPTGSQIQEIADWVSANLGLPGSTVPPRVELARPAKMRALRYGDGIPQPAPMAEDHGKTTLEIDSTLLAVYDRSTQTIYLPIGWSGASAAETSILVHEMVHHLQNVGNVRYECAAARERPAYVAQDRWLRRFGEDLESAFEVDMFTVVVKSAHVY